MNAHNLKLVVFTETGSQSHIAADVDVRLDGSGPARAEVLTLCGMLVVAETLVNLRHNQVSCERCRKSSSKYGHRTGIV